MKNDKTQKVPLFASLDPAEGRLGTGRLRGWLVEEIGEQAGRQDSDSCVRGG